MKVIIKNNVVVAIAETAEQISNGILVDNNVIYAEPNLVVHDVGNVPEGVRPQEYKYVNGEFVKNENYAPPKEDEIAELKQLVADLAEIVLLGGAK